MNTLELFFFAKYVSRLHLEEQYRERDTASQMNISVSFEDNYITIASNGNMVLYGREWDSWEVCGEFSDRAKNIFLTLGFKQMDEHCFQKNHNPVPAPIQIGG
jgi:hypothetical protein